MILPLGLGHEVIVAEEIVRYLMIFFIGGRIHEAAPWMGAAKEPIFTPNGDCGSEIELPLRSRSATLQKLGTPTE